MTRVNVLDEQDEAEMLERAIAMSLMEVDGEEELFGFTDHHLGEKLDHNTFVFKSNTESFECSDNEEERMHVQGVEEDLDDEEMLRQAIAMSLEDV